MAEQKSMSLDQFKKTMKSTGAQWREGRKATPGNYENIQSDPGKYDAVLETSIRTGTGKIAGCPILVFACTVSDGDAEGQVNRDEFIFNKKDVDRLQQTYEALARCLKKMFPAHAKAIAEMDLADMLDFVGGLVGEQCECLIEVTEGSRTIKENGKDKKVTRKYLNIMNVDAVLEDEEEGGDDEPEILTFRSDEDDEPEEEDLGEDEDESDEDDEAEEEEPEEDDEDEEEEAEEDDEEEEYVPEKGDTVYHKRKKKEVVTVATRKRTVTLKDRQGVKATGVSWDAIKPAD